MPKYDFKIVTASDVPPGLAAFVVSSLREGGSLFDMPVQVSEELPLGEVWVYTRDDASDAPSVKIHNISSQQSELTMEATFKHPLKTIGMHLVRAKEDL